MPKVSAIIAVALVAFAGTGCRNLPIAGPLASDVVANKDTASPAHIDYAVVDVTENICDILNARNIPSFVGTFGISGPPPDHKIGIGDGVAITIWEAGAGGLFSNPIPVTMVAPSSRGVSLPEMTVTQDGAITVPYAGRLDIAGKFPAEAEAMIVAALKGKAVEPQVLVTVTRSIENSATLAGEVTNGARVPLSVKGDHILDVIAAAGGVRAPINEAMIRLTRDGRTVEVPFVVLVQNPKENIYVEPGDVITVVHMQQTFTSFGALGRNFQIPFEMDTISAEEAVAKAGGLIDQRADPSGMFVLRFEREDLARQLTPGKPITVLPSGHVPVIYHVDLRNAGAYFLARQFSMRNKDIVYVANAPLNEVEKFLALIGAALGPLANAATIEYSLTVPR